MSEPEFYDMKRSDEGERERFLTQEIAIKEDEIKNLKSQLQEPKNPDGWVIIAPGKENLAFHHKHTAETEFTRLDYKKIKPFKYLV